MTSRTTSLGSTIDSQERTQAKKLLLGGVLAGPFYVAVALAQAVTRPGFDLRRHDISALAIGSLGWIQIANFLISGLLVVAAAIGLHRELAAGPGRTWGPRLVGLYGVCIMLAGIFVTDPVGGFPPDAPPATTLSWHGGLHLLCATAGFLGLIAACLVFGRRFFSQGRRAWGAYSTATGTLFFVTFFGSVMLSGSESTASLAVLGLWIAVLLGWAWLTAISAKELSA